jgi:FkbM family methyltransferase
MKSIFGNDNPITNGELFFLNEIKKNLNIVFDVGSRKDSLFLDLECEVHYFEPVPEFIMDLKLKSNNNKKSFFNDFGLSDNETKLFYYKSYQSFINRNKTFSNKEVGKIELLLKKASDYIVNNKIDKIDFLKIDTEGFEFNVIKGFEDKIGVVDIIQFEYGGTYLDANIKLIEVVDYLKNKNFENFSYLSEDQLVKIEDFSDHYKYCNIICFNKRKI